ncbi:uncharacterized protein B0J16DRAFT_336274 [Fusarium flagelliforme]|uniref:uncharacterized protein n=1 Tax=Fusarium flagelliforme TaxID=2675880 RepID=UPI001E8DF53D|nr:uncharacterized protein B0J16DRAFT_336274 [Fusarium flagelliforme]KAH7193945.1 hypothetical protein B0J16DRAFT_336274 [Fusarium flagelliforme]
MAVTSTRLPSHVQIPDTSNDSHPELAWIPVMVLLFFALVTFILVGAPKLYAWVRHRNDPPSSSSSASTTNSDCEPRDLPHLDAVAPPKTSETLRSELSQEEHPTWAVPVTNMTCVICLEVVKGTDVVRHLACEHTFHADCIASWYFAEHDTCPICACRFSSPGPMPQKPRSAHV